MAVDSFIFGAGTDDTSDSLKRKRQIAAALLQSANRAPRNVGEAFGQGLTGIGEALLYRKLSGDIDTGEKKMRAAGDADFAPLMGGSPFFSASPTGAAADLPKPGAASEMAGSDPKPTSGVDTYRNAIASIESDGSGGYNAIGPTHPKMGRALGRYQIMEANIGPWSQEALGRTITPEEFMADPKLQDAIFDKKFGGYVDRFGPEGAAQAWFAGPGGVGKTNRKDSLGTTVAAYSQKFNNAVGNGSAASAIEAQAPGSGYVDPTISAPNYQPPAFDAGRFGDPIKLAEMPAGMDDAAQRLSTQATAYAADPQGAVGGLPPLPSREVSTPPTVAAPPASPPTASAPVRALLGQNEPAQNLPTDYFPAAPNAPGQSGPSNQQILRALTSPNVTPEQRSVAQMLFKQRLDESNPDTQLDRRYKQAHIDRLSRPGYRMLSQEERQRYGIPADDNRPYQVGPEGQISAIGGMGQTQTPGVEARQRAELAKQYGIDPASAEGQRFILTGTLPTSDKGVTAGDREAIRDSDDAVMQGENTLGLLDKALELSNKSLEGFGAGTRALIGSQFGNEASLATREFDNIVTEQALGQLKAIFGGAPTEGERQILLDIQGSSSQPKTVRDNILRRARQLVERRIQYNRDRASDLRGNTYYKPRAAGQPATPPAATAPQTNPNVDDLLKKYGG